MRCLGRPLGEHARGVGRCRGSSGRRYPGVGQCLGPLETERLFVEEGVIEPGRGELSRAITDADRFGVDLRVAVLAESGDAQAIAAG